MDRAKIIKENINNCLTETNFIGLGEKKSGKVRDTYFVERGAKWKTRALHFLRAKTKHRVDTLSFTDDQIILISTDRLSAFDRVLATIPFKGQILNQTSAWWMENTKHIIDNFVLTVPDPNVTVGKKCKVYPFEVIVRGYLSGSTSTSSWMNYQKGVRNFCGHVLPECMKKNKKFNQPIVTPTTKFEEHDRNITGEDIILEKMASEEEWLFIREKALELFKFGQETAEKNGLILVDTKYEFGKDNQGKILLIDEIHTPDSSRYWLADTYQERIEEGKEPDNIDKEFIRLWFKEHCDPYKDKEMPEAPEELVIELSRRYIMLYEKITGQKFNFPDSSQPIEERIKNNLKKYL